MNKLKLLTLLFSAELVFFIFGIAVYTVLLRIVRKSTKERLIRLLSGRQKRSLIDIKEKVIRSITKLKKIKIELFLSVGIVAIVFLCLWYLIKAQFIHSSLPCEFFLLGILIVIPLPLFVSFLEYFFRKIVERIEALLKL